MSVPNSLYRRSAQPGVNSRWRGHVCWLKCTCAPNSLFSVHAEMLRRVSVGGNAEDIGGLHSQGWTRDGGEMFAG
jgi:hypothetical protein